MIENSQLSSSKNYKLFIVNYELMFTFAHLFD